MAKKLELKFLTSANTELIVSIADPKDGLALSAVQAEAAKIIKFKLERDTIMAALRTVPFRRGNRERRKEYG